MDRRQFLASIAALLATPIPSLAAATPADGRWNCWGLFDETRNPINLIYHMAIGFVDQRHGETPAFAEFLRTHPDGIAVVEGAVKFLHRVADGEIKLTDGLAAAGGTRGLAAYHISLHEAMTGPNSSPP